MPPKPPPRPEGAKAGVPTTAKMPAKRPIGPKAPRRPVNPTPNASSAAAGPSKPRASLGGVKPKVPGTGPKRGEVKPDLAALERAEEERIRAAEAEWNELIRGGVGNFMDGEGKRIGDKLAAKSVKTVQVSGPADVRCGWRTNPQDKWELLPAFLKVKGLVKQHLDSYNYFVEHDIKEILKANAEVVSDVDNKYYIRYTNIYVCRPTRREGLANSPLTPQECRLTDSSYSGEIKIDIEYYNDGTTKHKKGVSIGYLPIMLRSNLCVLANKNEKQMARLGECPLDPGGYFVVKGTEKVILVQEQLSKNRVIVYTDPKKDSTAAEVTS